MRNAAAHLRARASMFDRTWPALAQTFEADARRLEQRVGEEVDEPCRARGEPDGMPGTHGGGLLQQAEQFIEQHCRQRVFDIDDLLSLGTREQVGKVVRQLLDKRAIQAVERGLYIGLPPFEAPGGFPDAWALVQALGSKRGDAVSPDLPASAREMGLRSAGTDAAVFLTSGPSRVVWWGRQPVQLQRAAAWLLIHPDDRAGHALRAFACAGETAAPLVAKELLQQLQQDELLQLKAVLNQVPKWLRALLQSLLPTDFALSSRSG